MSRGFLKPNIDGDIFSADRVDIDSHKDTSFVYNPVQSWSLNAQKSRLPIAKNRDHILYLLEKNQVLIIVGDTGCGKSTQVPQYLADAGWTDEKTMIGITEPRRVAVTTLAARVAEETKSRLGVEVGYSIRFDECFNREVTKIKFMTEGILIREMMADPLLKSYSVIILDEAHERTVSTDILMGLLKKVLKKRRDLRLIVSSATVDAEYIRDFFGNDKAAIISVHGNAYSVDIFYLEQPCPDYVKGCVDTVLKLHAVEPPGDVIVFLTGMDEVDHCVSMLREHGRSESQNKHGLKIWALPMYGSLPPQDQLKVFRPGGRGTRKIVVATNIAETSITIEGVAYVVDSSFVKMKWYNPDSNVDALIISEVSQASGQQRAGRAGRTRPGKCYRLCTEEDYLNLPLNTPPEMQRTDLSMAVLQLKALGIDNIVRFDFPSAPPSKNLISSMELLFALGALDERGRLTRPLGEQMSELPIHPTLSKMLFNSGEFGCVKEMAIIVAMLQIENVFMNPPGQSAKAKVAKRKFEVAEGDLLTLINVFNAFQSIQQIHAKHWCSSHFLRFKALVRATQLYQRLIKTLARHGLHVDEGVQARIHPGDTDNIRKCIVSGLFPNAAYLHMSGTYRTVRGDMEIAIHPTSVLYSTKQPSWVVFAEMVHTNKVLMRDLTVIDPSWLEILAPHYYEKTSVRT